MAEKVTWGAIEEEQKEGKKIVEKKKEQKKEFEIKEMESVSKGVYTIYGRKGCLVGGTEVKVFSNENTSDITLEKIFKNNKVIDVFSLNPEGEVVIKPAIPMISGKKEVYEIILSSGEKITSTLDHKFYILQNKSNIKEVKLSELEVGDKILKMDVSYAGEIFRPRERGRETTKNCSGERGILEKTSKAVPTQNSMSHMWEINNTFRGQRWNPFTEKNILQLQLPLKILHEPKESRYSPTNVERKEQKKIKEVTTAFKKNKKMERNKKKSLQKPNKENVKILERRFARDRKKFQILYDRRRNRTMERKYVKGTKIALERTSREEFSEKISEKRDDKFGERNGEDTKRNGSRSTMEHIFESGRVLQISRFHNKEAQANDFNRSGWVGSPQQERRYQQRQIIPEERLQYIAILRQRSDKESGLSEIGYKKSFIHFKTSLENILAIRKVGVRLTYDLFVKDTHNFILSNGILTHNSGKTTLALTFPGTIAALSFDKKTMMPKMNYFNGDKRIKVFNAVKYYSRETDEKNKSAEETYHYVLKILEELKEKQPDWVLIDGIEIFQKIAEGVMRHHHNLTPYQGVSNRNIWKERRDVIAKVHDEAIKASKRGVIYTTYTTHEEIVEEGTVVTKLEIPRYIDKVMWETDFVLNIKNNYDPKSKKTAFILRVVSSKDDKKMKTGTVVDVTGIKKIEDKFPKMKMGG